MALSFTIESQARAEAPDKLQHPRQSPTRWLVNVVVEDSDWPEVPCQFGISVLLHPDGYAVECWTEGVLLGRITPRGRIGLIAIPMGRIRDLPFTRWGTAAANVAVMAVTDDALLSDGRPVQRRRWKRRIRTVTQADIASLRSKQVERLVASRYPDLDDRTPADARKAATVRKFAEIAVDYRARLAAGSADPAGELAEEYKASAATVRVWVHRARQLGFLVGSAEAQSVPGRSMAFDYAVLYNELGAQVQEWYAWITRYQRAIRLMSQADQERLQVAGYESEDALKKEVEDLHQGLLEREAIYAETKAIFDAVVGKVNQSEWSTWVKGPMPSPVKVLIEERLRVDRGEDVE